MHLEGNKMTSQAWLVRAMVSKYDKSCHTCSMRFTGCKHMKYLYIFLLVK